MVEDNKNNDTKEELKTSSDGNDMDTQKINENENLNKKVNISSGKSENEDKSEKKLDDTNQEALNKKLESKDKSSEDNIEKENEIKNNDVSKVEEKNDNPDAKWYVVGAASGFEEKAVKTIKDNARKAFLSHFFFDFQVPKHEVVEIKRGKKINSEKNFFPGYMLIKMIMNNQTWQLVKNSNKISGFTGNDHKPIPLSQNEAVKMLKKADDSIEYIAPKYVYEVGQQVKVIDGPFASFNGMVEEVDEERGRLKISVSIFGRPTPVELEYTQVEKI